MAHLQDLLELGEKSNKYARELIKKSYTQLESNNLSNEDFEMLCKSIDDLRDAYEALDNLEIQNEFVTTFENLIYYVTKFSMGNCKEYAALALHYLMQNAPQTTAEVYRIRGYIEAEGDHTFLVIGRRINSDPNDPMTWDGVICDPYADKVYPSSEYLIHLKNFYFDKTDPSRNRNCLEKFDLTKHYLAPAPELANYNLEYLKSTNELQTNLSTRINYISNKLYYIMMQLSQLRNETHDQQLLAEISKIVSKVENLFYGLNEKLINCGLKMRMMPYEKANQFGRSFLKSSVSQYNETVIHYNKICNDITSPKSLFSSLKALFFAPPPTVTKKIGLQQAVKDILNTQP